MPLRAVVDISLCMCVSVGVCVCVSLCRMMSLLSEVRG